MAFARFKTLKRDQHRHGRVACLLDVDVPRKKLILNLLEARGLDAGFGKDRSTEDVYIQFRVQLLPAQDPVKVHKVISIACVSPRSTTPCVVAFPPRFCATTRFFFLFFSLSFLSFFFSSTLFLLAVDCCQHSSRIKGICYCLALF